MRLLTAHALWPFGYPDYEMEPSELFEIERAGLEAADEALRLGKPNLASGALDAAGGVSGLAGCTAEPLRSMSAGSSSCRCSPTRWRSATPSSHGVVPA